MAQVRPKKRALETDVLALGRQLSVSKTRISNELNFVFARKMTEAPDFGESPFRATYVRLFVDRV